VTIKTKVFRRHDGPLAAGAPRWDLVYEAPPVGSGNSGLRGLSCIDHLGTPAFVAIRTIRPSPWDPGVMFMGGYDANCVASDGTAWIAQD